MLQSRSNKTELSVMTDLLFVIAVLTFMSFFYYGFRAVVVVVISIAASFITDYICVKLRREKHDYKDLSAVVSGAVLALMMPASVSYGILIITNIFAIVIGKQIFGGHGKNIFSSAAVGFIFASFCWKDVILMYPKPKEHLALVSDVTNTLYQSLTQTLNIATTPSVSYFDILLGKFTGPMGSVHIIILLVCAVVLMFRRSISALTFCSGLGSILIFSYIFPKYGDSAGSSVFYELFSGMMVFGLIFLACDYFIAPKTRSSRFLYGILIGLLTAVFRHLSSVENAIVFAVIISNPLVISLDKSTLSFSKLSKELPKKIGVFLGNKGEQFSDKIKELKNKPKKENKLSDIKDNKIYIIFNNIKGKINTKKPTPKIQISEKQADFKEIKPNNNNNLESKNTKTNGNGVNKRNDKKKTRRRNKN